MATAKRKQEELGEECDDQEPHDNDPCSDDDDAKRPRLDIHHQHISHHQLPHHRQWSRSTACDEAKPFTARACDSDTTLKNAEDNPHASYDTEKYPTNYAKYPNSSDNYYLNFGGIYPEYVVPRSFCKEANDEAPCDLSNWQRMNKFQQGVGEQEPNSEVDSEHDVNNGDVTDDVQQPINFAYYHF